MSNFVLKTIKENQILEIKVNLRKIKSIGSFIDKMAEGFSFPDYFSGNPSSLDDCMRDLSWFEENEIHIHFQKFRKFKRG